MNWFEEAPGCLRWQCIVHGRLHISPNNAICRDSVADAIKKICEFRCELRKTPNKDGVSENYPFRGRSYKLNVAGFHYATSWLPPRIFVEAYRPPPFELSQSNLDPLKVKTKSESADSLRLND